MATEKRSEQIVIDQRFCGPPDSGNGGYVCGRLAAHVPGVAEVTLRLPPPLERPLQVARLADGSVELRDGEAVVAQARTTSFDMPSPEPVALPEAETAAKNSLALDDRSPFRTCFVCGSGRPPGDGLCIYPGPVTGRDMLAAPWLPDASLAGPDGMVPPEFVWAALDCPSGFAVGLGPEIVAVLGRLAAKQLAPVQVGRRYVITSWSTGSDGRKLFGASALFAEDGSLCGYARATWFRLEETAKAAWKSRA